jgi:uncharacterized protein YbbK (DUF523 family)
MTGRPVIGVSACLLGERVRYDGGDKLDRRLYELLSRDFELFPVCPEVAAGLGVPRPPVQLVGDPAHPRALGVEDRLLDVTERLEAAAHWAMPELGHLSGFVCKARSPSCGLNTTPLYDGTGALRATVSGLFARILQESYPQLPLEDEAGINDSRRYQAFLQAVTAYRS